MNEFDKVTLLPTFFGFIIWGYYLGFIWVYFVGHLFLGRLKVLDIGFSEIYHL